MQISLKSLIEALEYNRSYDKGAISLKIYIDAMNSILLPGQPRKSCSSCAGLMKRYQQEFLRAIWTQLATNYPDYVPEVPKFLSPNMITPFRTTQLMNAGVS